MAYEGRRGRKHKKWGSRGHCTYCGRVHKGGPKGDSCRGRSIAREERNRKAKR